jgi:hypothetical protein
LGRSLQNTAAPAGTTSPDIKHNRIPAPNMSFKEPNLPMLISEIEDLIAGLLETAEGQSEE